MHHPSSSQRRHTHTGNLCTKKHQLSPPRHRPRESSSPGARRAPLKRQSGAARSRSLPSPLLQRARGVRRRRGGRRRPCPAPSRLAPRCRAAAPTLAAAPTRGEQGGGCGAEPRREEGACGGVACSNSSCSRTCSRSPREKSALVCRWKRSTSVWIEVEIACGGEERWRQEASGGAGPGGDGPGRGCGVGGVWSPWCRRRRGGASRSCRGGDGGARLPPLLGRAELRVRLLDAHLHLRRRAGRRTGSPRRERSGSRRLRPLLRVVHELVELPQHPRARRGRAAVLRLLPALPLLGGRVERRRRLLVLQQRRIAVGEHLALGAAASVGSDGEGRDWGRGGAPR